MEIRHYQSHWYAKKKEWRIAGGVTPVLSVHPGAAVAVLRDSEGREVARQPVYLRTDRVTELRWE